MTSEKANRKEKNQNIQVFVRLRPLNQRERDIKSLGVVEVVNNREVVVRQSQQTSLTKRFTFDRAFGPYAKQVEVYQEVVSPLIEEVLAGYNCTVFAYGQTGTGKTHTMVGENTGDETTWQNDPLAGIIPRALSQLFDELRISNTEYTVRVSYLELYNEELFDLLSSSEDNSKLRIYEDVTRKGSNIVNGLEEITVYNKNEVYKIMAQGQERKRVASTLMNAQSSRSHTVFTIVVHMKENSPEGEELVKIGKLNLVDLAGSENISKAGSDNPAKKERARECVNINQSLLTLGRVITALVERHPHIPYRESKLTRILQESLGGRTKTSIIATISPGHKDLEETMSTLEYAYRAKNIQNKPEVNQKMTKKAILKEYVEEIDRLKRDLQAARDKNGVYLASETFAEITLKQEEQRKEIQELLLKKRAMEEERERMEMVFSELSGQLESRGYELEDTKGQLRSTKNILANTTNVLKSTQLQFEEQRHLAACRGDTEQQLGAQAQQILAVADVATAHVHSLHDNVDKRKRVENSNLEVTRGYREESSRVRARLAGAAAASAQRLAAALDAMQHALDNYAIDNTQSQEQNESRLKALVLKTKESLTAIKSLFADTYVNISATTDTQLSSLHSANSVHSENLQRVQEQFVGMCNETQKQLNSGDVTSNVANFVNQWRADSEARLSSLQQCHSAFGTRASTAEKRSLNAARTRRDSKRSRIGRRATHVMACIAAIAEEKVFMDKRLTQKLEDIDNLKRETEERLQAWMEEERRLLEERLARHVTLEKKALEDRLVRHAIIEKKALEDRVQKEVTEIEQQRKLLEERISRDIEIQRTQLQAYEEEIEIAEGDLEECEKEKMECLQNVDVFAKEFEEGTSAFSADIKTMSSNVLQIVEQFSGELKHALQHTTQLIEQEVSNLLATDKEANKQFTDSTNSILSGVVKSIMQTLDAVIDKIEGNSMANISELNHISSSTSSLKEATAAHVASQRDAVTTAREHVAQLEADVRTLTDVHAQIEAQYLAEQYTTYSPTGNTPVRQEYRYPRALAATSPPERLLARFRATRQNSHDDECIVIESDVETRPGSDSESSVSEDSAVAFAAPSPPAPLAPSVPDDSKSLLASNAPNSLLNALPVKKSISESDIFSFRKQQQQGKENANRSVTSIKKPSKLPAPTLHKKPLAERNIST